MTLKVVSDNKHVISDNKQTHTHSNYILFICSSLASFAPYLIAVLRNDYVCVCVYASNLVVFACSCVRVASGRGINSKLVLRKKMPAWKNV